MRSSISLNFKRNDMDNFEARCTAAIDAVGNGTKWATEEAAKEILEESKAQVPVHTATLLQSAYYEVQRRASGTRFEATIGYGGNGDPINPITGQPASSYMVAVHEDLSAYHPVGKAKFLEDPVRAYTADKYNQKVLKMSRKALSEFSD